MKVLIALLVALAAQVPPPAPTLTADPADADPGAAVTVTVTGCTGTPVVVATYQLSDSRGGPVGLTDQGGGTWTGTFTAPDQDVVLFFDPSAGEPCGEGDPREVVVDVEHPQLVVGPVPAVLDEGQIMGTDCPPETIAATVTVRVEGDVVREVRAPTDSQGDWLDALPPDLGPGDVEVDASCGDLAYPTYRYVVPGEAEVPEAPVPVPSPAAPPADAVPAPARFTG